MAAVNGNLDFVGGFKRKVAAARSYRCDISSKSGTEFRGNESIQIELPTIARSYAGLTSMVLEAYIKTNSAQNASLCASGCDVINRARARGGGAVIGDCRHLNLYYNAVLAQNLPHEFMRGHTTDIAGHRGDVGPPLGVALSETTPAIRVPLLHSIATCGKLLPLATSSG